MITRGFLDVESNDENEWWFTEPITKMKQFLRPIDENIIDEATNLKNIEKSLQEPNVEKAMSFIRVRLDYLDHKQKSFNFDRKI